MKAGSLVRVVHRDPGLYPEVAVWDAATANFRGEVRHGDVFLMVRPDQRRDSSLPRQVGWAWGAEIVHPEWGGVLIDQSYLEAVNE